MTEVLRAGSSDTQAFRSIGEDAAAYQVSGRVCPHSLQFRDGIQGGDVAAEHRLAAAQVEGGQRSHKTELVSCIWRQEAKV